MPRQKMTEDEKKSRITLNINEELLTKLDKLVDEQGDNRSRLIENLLKEYIKEKLK